MPVADVDGRLCRRRPIIFWPSDSLPPQFLARIRPHLAKLLASSYSLASVWASSGDKAQGPALLAVDLTNSVEMLFYCGQTKAKDIKRSAKGLVARVYAFAAVSHPSSN